MVERSSEDGAAVIFACSGEQYGLCPVLFALILGVASTSNVMKPVRTSTLCRFTLFSRAPTGVCRIVYGIDLAARDYVFPLYFSSTPALDHLTPSLPYASCRVRAAQNSSVAQVVERNSAQQSCTCRNMPIYIRYASNQFDRAKSAVDIKRRGRKARAGCRKTKCVVRDIRGCSTPCLTAQLRSVSHERPLPASCPPELPPTQLKGCMNTQNTEPDLDHDHYPRPAKN